MPKLKYKRILLKLSGEAFLGDKSFGINGDAVTKLCKVLQGVKKLGVELSIVIGGGNILRGRNASKEGVERSTADYMGMLATIMNALALQDALEKMGEDVRVLSALNVPQVAEPYIRRKAVRHLEKERIVVFAGGTGNPYFSTDTGAALRALEIGAEVIIKATKVDGVYDRDPKKDKNAKKFEKIHYKEIIHNDLQIMDHAAVSLCRENDLPIIVLNLFEKDAITKALLGGKIGTHISN